MASYCSNPSGTALAQNHSLFIVEPVPRGPSPADVSVASDLQGVLSIGSHRRLCIMKATLAASGEDRAYAEKIESRDRSGHDDVYSQGHL
jgi:hypothetical protein